MTIRIYTKRSFQFDHPEDRSLSIIAPMEGFTDAPDWVKDSSMFKLALIDNDVIVANGAKEEDMAEASAAQIPALTVPTETPVVPTVTEPATGTTGDILDQLIKGGKSK